jgi:hypothetical protein
MAYPFRAILSPIQFDDLSLPALGFAKSIAKDKGATLHLLHVVAMVSALGGTGDQRYAAQPRRGESDRGAERHSCQAP